MRQSSQSKESKKQNLEKIYIGDGIPIKLHENWKFQAFWDRMKKIRTTAQPGLKVKAMSSSEKTHTLQQSKLHKKEQVKIVQSPEKLIEKSQTEKPIEQQKIASFDKLIKTSSSSSNSSNISEQKPTQNSKLISDTSSNIPIEFALVRHTMSAVDTEPKGNLQDSPIKQSENENDYKSKENCDVSTKLLPVQQTNMPQIDESERNGSNKNNLEAENSQLKKRIERMEKMFQQFMKQSKTK